MRTATNENSESDQRNNKETKKNCWSKGEQQDEKDELEDDDDDDEAKKKKIAARGKLLDDVVWIKEKPTVRKSAEKAALEIRFSFISNHRAYKIKWRQNACIRSTKRVGRTKG